MMDDLGNLQGFALLAGNQFPTGSIDWSRVRVIAWFDPAAAPESADPVTDADVGLQDDPLDRFLTECTIRDAGAQVQSSVLYDAYAAWCDANGQCQWRQKGFSRSLKNAGFVTKVRDGMYWLGLRLKPVATGQAETEGPKS